MKQILTLAAGAALALASCVKEAPEALTLADAGTFADSLSIISGQRVGLMALYDLENNVPDSINKKEMLRGALDVINTVDTANISYIYGQRMGQMLWMNFRDMGAMTDGVSKRLFVQAMREAFMADSFPSDEVAKEQYEQFTEIFERAEAMEQARREQAIMESDAARENRTLAVAVSEKLISNPDFRAAGSDGILMHEITPGNGEKPAGQDIVLVDLTISRIGSGERIQDRQDMAILAANPRNDLLGAVLPLMSMGQTAEFFVPYKYAFGVAGNEHMGVGPCESVMARVTLKPRP